MKLTKTVCLMMSLCLFGCATQKAPVEHATQSEAPAATETPAAPEASKVQSMLDPSNPFAQPSTMPYGIPAFDKIRSEHFLPAIEAGMTDAMAEIEAIANQTDPATFENTIVAMEKSGALLERALRTFSNLNSTHTDDILKQTQLAVAPKLAAHDDAVYMNDALFKRVDAIYQARETLGLDAESLRLVERYYTDFVRAGAKLDAAQKEILKSINIELATLTTQFGQNILADTNDSAVWVENQEELAGLTTAEIETVAAAAKAKGHDGKYLITLRNTSIQPVLANLENRALRERVHAASLARCSRGNAYDNGKLIAQIVTLRAKRAELLGYRTHADYILDDQTAKTVDAVNKRLNEMVPAAKASIEREAAELQLVMNAHQGNDKLKLAAHDWSYYADDLRSQKYEINEAELKPYFELNNVVTKGVFYAAEKLYGIKFVERKDIPLYHPDVRIWEVFDANGESLALFIGDFFARETKRGGAWMNSYVIQSKLNNTRPVIGNHSNIEKPAGDAPVLLTLDEVTTLFHEFGHALHGMFSDVQYPRFAGTSVTRDFVEFPSQFNEIWALWPEIVENYAIHYQTGEKIPAQLLEKIQKSDKFNQGYATTEYLAAAVVDQYWHQMTSADIAALGDFSTRIAEIEQEFLTKAGLNLDYAPPRYKSAYYNHVFAGGYSAGYYAYIWAEVLDADAEQWFQVRGLTRDNGDRLRSKVLSKGGSIDAMTLYRDFADREPSIEPLLVRRGLK